MANGNDIYCISMAAAIAIVKFYPGNVGPEIHGNGDENYFPHYHINRSSHVHIFFSVID